VNDLFGEQRVRIDGNPKLEGIANHVLELVHRNPSLLDGDTVGEINRKVYLDVMLDSGLVPILKSGDVEKFKEWFLNKKNCDTEEEVARSLRYLIERDLARISAKAVKAAEENRQRIARSVKR
jgi:signal transduction histidine kinase